MPQSYFSSVFVSVRVIVRENITDGDGVECRLSFSAFFSISGSHASVRRIVDEKKRTAAVAEPVISLAELP